MSPTENGWEPGARPPSFSRQLLWPAQYPQHGGCARAQALWGDLEKKGPLPALPATVALAHVLDPSLLAGPGSQGCTSPIDEVPQGHLS